MKQIVSLEVEEFEGGAWVADAVSLEQFDGSFELAGETWTGAMVNERQEGARYYTRIVGGAGKLGVVLQDKYYDGSVSLQAAVQDISRAAGETFGEAKTGSFLTTFERIRMPAYAALDAIVAVFDLEWWIGRDGKVHVLAERPSGTEAKGQRIASDVDSVLLREPEDLTLGASYDDKPIRHIRWTFSAERFEARAYFLPFVFLVPTNNRYDSHEDAKIDKDNGDGTVDVIVGGRYGLTKIKLFCGVPHSKVKVDPGDLVTVGYFGGDPQKPYAVAMAQDTGATKEVARRGDTVEVTLTADAIATISSPTGPCTGGPITISGEVKTGSQRLKVGD